MIDPSKEQNEQQAGGKVVDLRDSEPRNIEVKDLDNGNVKEKNENQNQGINQKSNKTKIKDILRISIFVVLIVAVSLILGSLYNLYKKNIYKNNHLTFVTSNFKQIIDQTNNLNTEAVYFKKPVNDLYIKELQDERAKTSDAIIFIKDQKKELEKKRPAPEYSNLQEETIDLADNLKDELKETREYYNYLLKINEINLSIILEKENLETNFLTSTNITELQQKVLRFEQYIEITLRNAENIIPPEGLEKYHSKAVNEIEELYSIIMGLRRGIDANTEDPNISNINQSITAFNKFEKDNKVSQELEDLMDFYLEKKQEKMNNLRKEADKIKTKIIIYSYESKREIPVIDIEGW